MNIKTINKVIGCSKIIKIFFQNYLLTLRFFYIVFFKEHSSGHHIDNYFSITCTANQESIPGTLFLEYTDYSSNIALANISFVVSKPKLSISEQPKLLGS